MGSEERKKVLEMDKALETNIKSPEDYAVEPRMKLNFGPEVHEQVLASYGWKGLAEVYGDVPGLSERLEEFLFEPMSKDTMRRITNAVSTHLMETRNLRELPVIGTWTTEHGHLVLITKTR